MHYFESEKSNLGFLALSEFLVDPKYTLCFSNTDVLWLLLFRGGLSSFYYPLSFIGVLSFP